MPDASVRESVIEAYLVKRVKSLGSSYPYYRVTVKKIGGPGWRGWPDRVVLYEGGFTHWLEVKRPKGGRFEPLQLRRHETLRRMGYVVRVVNTRTLVDEYIAEVVRVGLSRVPVNPVCT